MPIGELGPHVAEYLEGYIAHLKAFHSVAANPIGASSQSHRVESVGSATGADVNDTGPICATYDPELVSILGFELG